MAISKDGRQASTAHAGGQAPSPILAKSVPVATALLVLLVAGCAGKAGSGTAAGSSATASSAGVTSPAAAPEQGGTAAGSQTPAPVDSNPPGDIPDNVAYVSYRNAVGRYTFVHPEGWTSVVNGGSVTFTDKLNGTSATVTNATSAPTVATAQEQIAALRSTQPAFELRGVKPATLPGGKGVLIIFRRNSTRDAVTGKVFRDEVNRFEIYQAGRILTLDLYGAVGSDNVDPYTKISQSLRLS
jgi:hypothetical protein